MHTANDKSNSGGAPTIEKCVRAVQNRSHHK